MYSCRASSNRSYLSLPFNIVQEQKVGNLRKQCKNKDDPAVGYQSHTPKCSMAHNLFRVVEVAVDARVDKTNCLVVKEKIAIEPAKVTQDFIDRNRSPNVETNENEAKCVTKKSHTIGPVFRQCIHFPTSNEESDISHAKGKIVDAAEGTTN